MKPENRPVVFGLLCLLTVVGCSQEKSKDSVDEGNSANAQVNENSAIRSCQDGLDNDGDGFIDFPQDIGCSSAEDTDETNSPGVSVFDSTHPNSDRLEFVENFLSENPAFSDSDGGTFRITCAFSHFNYDDPIVYPNSANAAHLHMYFGNINVDHDSTTPEILQQSEDSTCVGGPLNKTAYWVPSVISPLFMKEGSIDDPNRGFMIDADERPIPVTDADG